MSLKDTASTVAGALLTFMGVRYLHSIRPSEGILGTSTDKSFLGETVTKPIHEAQCAALQRKINNIEQRIRDEMAKGPDANPRVITNLQRQLVAAVAQRREAGCL